MTNDKDLHPTSRMSQLTEIVSFNVNIDIIQNSEFQEFIKKLEHSQHVIINMDEIDQIVSISGKKGAVGTAQVQIQHKIDKLSSVSTKKRWKTS